MVKNKSLSSRKLLFPYIETKCFSTVCKGSENQLTIK